MEEGFLRLSRRFFSNEMWKVAREFSECEAWLDLIQHDLMQPTRRIANSSEVEKSLIQEVNIRHPYHF